MEKYILNPKMEDASSPEVMFSDTDTDFVYISDKLKVFYSDTFRCLTRLFNEMEIEWGEVKDTKDIWIRDYMPVQVDSNKFLVYDYDPDYLKASGSKYKTDSHTVFEDYLDGAECQDIHVKLDGGNLVPCCGSFVLTNKVFTENGTTPDDSKFLSRLTHALGSDVVILPWHREVSSDPRADVYGHADGFVKWTSGRQMLMSNVRDSYPQDADTMRKRLEEEDLDVTEMLFDVPNPNPDFNWAYINYLQVGHKIIVPVFGIAEDRLALKYIHEANPDCEVRTIRLRDIANQGGGLHCITWNVKKPNGAKKICIRNNNYYHFSLEQ